MYMCKQYNRILGLLKSGKLVYIKKGDHAINTRQYCTWKPAYQTWRRYFEYKETTKNLKSSKTIFYNYEIR